MLMTGDPITAHEAHRLGMVNEIHPQKELMTAAHRIAEKIASNSPQQCKQSSEPFIWAKGSPSSRRSRS